MSFDLPLNGGSRILYRPQPGGPVRDIRHFWVYHAALGGVYSWVIGHVVGDKLIPFAENVHNAQELDGITWTQQNHPGGKGAWYVSKVARINELLDRYADVTPDDFVPNGPFDLENDNIILQGYFRMKPSPTDTEPVFEVYYRPDPLAAPPKEIWDYT